jgi:parallel beta-helix repeat protein
MMLARKNYIFMALIMSLFFSACNNGAINNEMNSTLNSMGSINHQLVNEGSQLTNEDNHQNFSEINDQVPVFLIGDSTVRNQYSIDGKRVGWGWGDVLPNFAKVSENIHSFARSGSSSLSYFTLIPNWSTEEFWGDGKSETKYGNHGAKYAILHADRSKGGFLLIQFGHNDAITSSDTLSSIDTTTQTAPEENINNATTKEISLPNDLKSYEENLRHYINFALEQNLTPVLITPVSRMMTRLIDCPKTPPYNQYTACSSQHFYYVPDTKSSNPFRGEVLDYPKAMKRVQRSYAKEGKRVLLLDLQKASFEKYKSFSIPDNELVRRYGSRGIDRTHFNKDGASLIAGLIVQLACDKTSGDTGLCMQFNVFDPSSKNTKFASPNGTGDGLSADVPLSLEDALAGLEAGDLLMLRGGIYKKWDRLLINSVGGTKENPIIIESYPGERAIIDGGGFESGKAGFELWGGNGYIYIRNLEIRNMAKNGIQIKTSHNRVEGCYIHDNRAGGVHIMSSKSGGEYTDGYNIIKDNIIANNSDAGLSGGLYDNGDNADGVSVSSGTGNKILNNVIYGNSDDGIDTWQSNDTEVAYNKVYDNGRGTKGNGNGIKLGGYLAADKPIGMRAYAHHNISYKNKGLGFDLNAGRDVKIEYNTSYGNGDLGYGNLQDGKVVLRKNISYSDNGFASNAGTQIDNSWQRVGEIKFLSTDPASKDFLKVAKESPFADLGAFANLQSVY